VRSLSTQTTGHEMETAENEIRALDRLAKKGRIITYGKKVRLITERRKEDYH
jgi:hypothetical protein